MGHATDSFSKHTCYKAMAIIWIAEKSSSANAGFLDF